MRYRIWHVPTDIVHMVVDVKDHATVPDMHYVLCGIEHPSLSLKEYDRPVNCPGCLAEIERQKAALRD